MSDTKKPAKRGDTGGTAPAGKPANSAPDAVKDPNEKTDGKPGLPPGSKHDGEADPGGG